ncbi:hypothetical protein V6N11_041357 [Hibiscus sabdariffa]|uniref:RING-type E3 ubiquitin transferase n=1 Tax=Hibiscus sabdariffa TaxID=183260 RepID=A0ABR2RKL5_9ROSI
MSSDQYEWVLQDIIQCGFETVWGMLDQGCYCQALQLHSNMLVEPNDISMYDLESSMTGAMEESNGYMSDLEISMTGALEESRREFENNNYGMVGATESSVKNMVKKVRVEDGEEGDCMVCLEELSVGFEASQMPCSHIFHGSCIERWLNQSHYCPICRFEMPTN